MRVLKGTDHCLKSNHRLVPKNKAYISFHEFREIWTVAFMRLEIKKGRICGLNPHIFRICD